MLEIGTNYYIKCEHCKHEVGHIGKSAAGYNFRTNISKDDLKILLNKHGDNWIIENEYNEQFLYYELLRKTTETWDWRIPKVDWKNSGWC